MATLYPGAKDDGTTLPNPTAGSLPSNPSHGAQHANVNDAVKAVQTKLGTGASVPATNTLLLGTGAGTSAWSQATSSQLAASLTDETGTGAAVFGTTPTLVTPKVDTINENTLNNGVTIDGVNLKDGLIPASAIPAASITPGKINLGPATHAIATDQTTSSTVYADLATVGPLVTVNIGTNGLALVILSAGLYGNVNVKQMSYTVSGASTVAASNTNALRQDSSAPMVYSATFLQTGLTPGSNTFTAKYLTSAGTMNVFNRTITVIPL